MRLKIIILLVFVLFPSALLACSCEQTTLAERFKRVPFVFVGTLVAAEQVFSLETHCKDPKYPNISIRKEFLEQRAIGIATCETLRRPQHIKGQFEVTTLFKGEKSELPKIIIFQPGSCGFEGVIGHYYLIYTDRSGGTTVCAGSKYLGYNLDLDPDVEALKAFVHDY